MIFTIKDMNKKPEILAIVSSIESTSFSDVQSITQLLEYGFKLTQWIAFSGEAMSEAKEQLHIARAKAYINVHGSLTAQGHKIAPSLLKDYVNDQCAAQNGFYELCERCNRASTHAMDLVRTAISALKTEMSVMNFQSSR